MKIYISLIGRAGKYNREEVLKIYKIGQFYIMMHEDHYNNELIFKIYFNKQRIILGNKNLTKIYNFYRVLNNLEENSLDKLGLSNLMEDYVIYMQGGQDMFAFSMNNAYDEGGGKESVSKEGIYYWGPVGEFAPGGEDIKEGRVSYKEFYLLMQLYFGLYKNNELKEELEEKEEAGVYYVEQEEMVKWRENNDERRIEFHKLLLMRKDTTGAFGGIEVEKIYDKNWDDERKRRAMEEINKEYGEEVLVIEEE